MQCSHAHAHTHIHPYGHVCPCVHAVVRVIIVSTTLCNVQCVLSYICTYVYTVASKLICSYMYTPFIQDASSDVEVLLVGNNQCDLESKREVSYYRAQQVSLASCH